MKGLPEQWTRLHIEFVTLAAHPLGASCSCINTRSFSLPVQCISTVCVHSAGSAFKGICADESLSTPATRHMLVDAES